MSKKDTTRLEIGPYHFTGWTATVIMAAMLSAPIIAAFALGMYVGASAP